MEGIPSRAPGGGSTHLALPACQPNVEPEHPGEVERPLHVRPPRCSMVQGTDQDQSSPSGMTVEVGAATVVNEGQVGTDTHTVDSLGCSITVMPTWPQLHPLAVPDEILSIANQPDVDGFPEWLSSQ